MWSFLKISGVDIAIVVVAVTVLMSGPAWAVVVLPGPAASGLIAAVAIVGALVVTKWWRRK